MTAPPPSDRQDLDAARRVDEACDRFEAAWKAAVAGGPWPTVADFLDDATVNLCDLLRELIAIDRHYRGRVGDSATALDRADASTILYTPNQPFAETTDYYAHSPAINPKLMPPGFELVGELGRGGMGVVYRARQPLLGRDVALKVLKDGDYSSPERRVRFLTEAEAAASLNHPGIVQVYQFGTHAGLPYMALEYCPNGTLADRLAGGPLPPREAASVLEKLAQAVMAAHARGVVHRDLKPANILYSAAGAPKVADFGLARRTDGPGLTVTGEVMGTPAYMAPEQAEGKRVTGAADVYSLGAILYECLTGRPPFTGANPAEILMRVLKDEPPAAGSLVPGVPGDLAIICHQCLNKDPARRYGSAAALEADLRAFLDGRPISAKRVTRRERVWKWVKRYPLAAGMIALAALTLVAGTTVSTIFAVRAGERAAERELARIDAKTSENAAKVQAAAATAAAVRMFRDRGFLAYKMNDGPEGLLWNVHTLANLPADAADARAEMRRHAGAWATHALPIRHVFPHGGKITAVAVSPDGSLLAVGGEDGVARLYVAETGIQVGGPMKHRKDVNSMAFTPDGRKLVTCCRENEVRVWDAATAAPLCPPLHAPWAPALAVRPDGSAFLVLGADHPPAMYSLADYKKIPLTWDEPPPTKGPYGAAFSPDGKTLALAMNAGDIPLLAWPGGKPVRAPIRISRNPVLGVAFAGTSDRLAVAGWLGEAGVWNVQSGLPVWSLPRAQGQVLSTAVTGDGHAIFGGGDGSARVVTADGQTWPLSLRHLGPVSAVAADTSGKWVLTGGHDGFARLWTMRPHAWRDAERAERTAAFAESGEAMLHVGQDAARVTRPGRAPVTLPTGPAANGALSPDGGTALVVTHTGKAQFWDVATAARVGPEIDGKFHIAHVRFSPDGKRAAAWGWTTPVLLLDPAGGRVIDKLMFRDVVPPYPMGAISVKFSRDSQRLFAGGSLNNLRTWSATDGKLVHTFPDGGWSYCVAVGPSRVATGLASNEVFLADAATGKQDGGPLSHPGIVWSVAFTADDRRLLTGCYDGMLRLWDTETRTLVGRPWEGHTRAAEWLAFHPTRPLAMSADKQAVRWWDADGGRPLGPPMATPAGKAVTNVALSADGAATLVQSGNVFRRVPLPPAFADDPALLRQWVAVHFGLTVTAENEGVPLTPDAWHAEWLDWRNKGRPSPFVHK